MQFSGSYTFTLLCNPLQASFIFQTETLPPETLLSILLPAGLEYPSFHSLSSEFDFKDLISEIMHTSAVATDLFH